MSDDDSKSNLSESDESPQSGHDQQSEPESEPEEQPKKRRKRRKKDGVESFIATMADEGSEEEYEEEVITNKRQAGREDKMLSRLEKEAIARVERRNQQKFKTQAEIDRQKEILKQELSQYSHATSESDDDEEIETPIEQKKEKKKKQKKRADAHGHRTLDQAQPDDAEVLALQIAARHNTRAELGAHGDRDDREDSELLEQKNLPTVMDPRLWMVKCLPGREQDCAIQLMRRWFERREAGKPLLIKSVVAYPSARTLNNQSYIYVEAYKESHVKEAIKGLEVLKYGQWKQDMVPLKEMPSILRVSKPKMSVKPGKWVRFRRTVYKGDLAKVFKVDEGRNQVSVFVVPRIDLSGSNGNEAGKKRGRPTTRPQQRLFDADDPDWSQVQTEGKNFSNGLLIKIMPITSLIIEGVKPSIKELRYFEGIRDRFEDETDHNSQSSFQFHKGDAVEVTEGELNYLQGHVLSIDGETVTIQPHHEDLNDPLPFPASQLRKFFKIGDHVKVSQGKFSGETGLVVHVMEDGPRHITLVSDNTMKELKVFDKDLQLCQEVSSGLDSLGQFELHDLVQIDSVNVGCITRIERESLKVLDQNGQEKTVKLQEVSARKRRRGSALDSEQNEITPNAVIKVIDGPNKGREGKVLHVYRSFVFVYQRTLIENGGVFVCRSRHLLIPGAVPKPEEKKLGLGPRVLASPNIHGNGRGARRGGARGRGRGRGGGGRGRRRHELVYQTVRIVSGPYKGYVGVVRDATDTMARVELHTKSRTISVDITKVKPINDNVGSSKKYPSGSFGNGAQTPMYGSQTPMYGAATPMHGAQTPMYGSQTPSYGMATPSHDGSRTPSHGANTPSHTDDSEVWNPRVPNTPGTPGGPSTPGMDQPETPGKGVDDYESGPTPNAGGNDQDWSGPTPSGTPSNDWGQRDDYNAEFGTPGNPETPYGYTPQPYTPEPYGQPASAGPFSSDTPSGSFKAPTPYERGSTPGGDYHPDTPGYQPAATPYNPPTPGAGPRTPGSFTASTPMFQANTPGATLTAATPGNPFTPSAYNPVTPGDMSQADNGLGLWYKVGAVVKHKDTADEGVIHGVDEKDQTCDVILNKDQSRVTVDCDKLVPVPPSKTEHVLILSGEYQGNTGTLLNIDGSDGIIKLDGGQNLLKIFQLSTVAKYEAVD
eukprot:m.58744 g.58744  ORF g.58744 m.58744 type:complete len:1162 (-) comp19039_c0_seq2:55-3540(-)